MMTRKVAEVGSMPESDHEIPDMKTLRNSIPDHCFTADTYKSLNYVARDLLLVTVLGYLATYIPCIESSLARWTLWALYGFSQGCVFTGIWILAHECGHGALFNHSALNNTIGFTLHSMLLVPFYSWKYSHGLHHRYTNNVEKDTAFVPAREDDFSLAKSLEQMFDIAEDTPIVSLLTLLGHQLLGWPLYLIFQITSGPKSSPTSPRMTNSHFDPLAGLFTPAQRPFVFLSDVGLAVTIASLFLLASHVGNSTTMLLYMLPYLWTNHWIVAITYLHHTHPDLHHYENNDWTFQKGALATVDREFGLIGKHLFHGIIEFHVVHHLFPRIPFYHAEEATKSIQPLLGKHYNRQASSFWSDLWTTFRQCKYVVPTSGQTGVLAWAKNVL